MNRPDIKIISDVIVDATYDTTNRKIISNVGEATRVRIWDINWNINNMDTDGKIDDYLKDI